MLIQVVYSHCSTGRVKQGSQPKKPFLSKNQGCLYAAGIQMEWKQLHLTVNVLQQFDNRKGIHHCQFDQLESRCLWLKKALPRMASLGGSVHELAAKACWLTMM